MSVDVYTVGSKAEASVEMEGDASNSVCLSLSNTFTICLSSFAMLLDEIDSHCQSLCNKKRYSAFTDY